MENHFDIRETLHNTTQSCYAIFCKVKSTPPEEGYMEEIRLKGEDERDRKRRKRFRKNGNKNELTYELEKI